MSYMIDPGYKHRKFVFETLPEAKYMANLILKSSKEIFAITETTRKATHVVYMDTIIDIPFPRTEPLTKQFEVGQKIIDYEFDGAFTIYKIARITKNRDKVLVTETWHNVDGSGKRKPSWHKVIEDEYGNEKFLIDQRYDSWIRA